MQDINKLVETFKTIGYTPPSTCIVLEELAYTLHASEIVLSVLEGIYNDIEGLLVATDLRILYIGCISLKEYVIKIIGYTEISLLEFKKHLSSIEIKTTETVVINSSSHVKSENFIKIVNALTIEKKRKLDDMKDLGTLTFSTE